MARRALASDGSGAGTKLALLGGEPANRTPAPRFPVFSDLARARVDALLRDGEVLSKVHSAIGEAEQALADWHGVGRCLGVSTGHAALHAAIIGLELTDGDEVITTPYTWGVPVAALMHNGAVPVFADVDPDTGLLDPASVQERIGERTRAILVVHLYGQVADLTRLREIADRHGLALIEDGSQAHGARHDGRLVGTVGDVSSFSCMGGKLLATTESGFMLTSRDDVYWKACISTQHAGLRDWPGASEWMRAGYPPEFLRFSDSLIYSYRLSTVNAVLLVEQLKKLDAENEARSANYERLRELMGDVRSVSVPEAPPTDNWVPYMLSFNFDREEAQISKETYIHALQAEGVPVYCYLPTPIHRLERMSPESSAPRVMWDALIRANADRIFEAELPGCEIKVARSFELGWNYIERDAEGVPGIADAFQKVEEHLPALRDFELQTASA